MRPITKMSVRVLVGAACCAALSAVAYGALFAGVKQKNEQISRLVNDIERRAEEERLLVSSKALVAETAPLREKLSNYFVAKDETVSFIGQLETLGRESGVAVAIASVEAAPHDSSEVAENLRLSVTFAGAWQAVVRYLGLLESLPLEARVEQAALSRALTAGASEWRGDVTLLVLKEK